MNTKSTRRRKVGVMIALVGFILIIFGKLLAAAVLLAASAHAAPNSDGRLYGDPTEAAEYWHPQHTGDCGLMAVADIVGQLTGKSPTEQQIIALAEQTPSVVRPGQPVWTPPTDPNDITTASGSKAPDEVVLLAHYGIDAVVTDVEIAATSDGIPTGLEALERYLASGTRCLSTSIRAHCMARASPPTPTTSWWSPASTPPPASCTSTTVWTRTAIPRSPSTPS
ncbi:MAG TPA: hypothetical protein VF874_08035 [Mycobacterium sp.]